jgi:hypothetical protein
MEVFIQVDSFFQLSIVTAKLIRTRSGIIGRIIQTEAESTDHHNCSLRYKCYIKSRLNRDFFYCRFELLPNYSSA